MVRRPRCASATRSRFGSRPCRVTSGGVSARWPAFTTWIVMSRPTLSHKCMSRCVSIGTAPRRCPPLAWRARHGGERKSSARHRAAGLVRGRSRRRAPREQRVVRRPMGRRGAADAVPFEMRKADARALYVAPSDRPCRRRRCRLGRGPGRRLGRGWGRLKALAIRVKLTPVTPMALVASMAMAMAATATVVMYSLSNINIRCSKSTGQSKPRRRKKSRWCYGLNQLKSRRPTKAARHNSTPWRTSTRMSTRKKVLVRGVEGVGGTVASLINGRRLLLTRSVVYAWMSCRLWSVRTGARSSLSTRRVSMPYTPHAPSSCVPHRWRASKPTAKATREAPPCSRSNSELTAPSRALCAAPFPAGSST
mmetsp:Transcript_22693/g.52665  ORF Transcript_22693/g.52665 Transcript_22693/m.52665 type:complete len:365 (+) Transcript_22693:577-1671(+)